MPEAEKIVSIIHSQTLIKFVYIDESLVQYILRHFSMLQKILWRPQ